MSETGFDITALQRRVIERAWRDEKFRKELIHNPNAVLSRELATVNPTAAIPEGVKIKVVEETPSLFYLVLPNNPSAIADLVSEDDLVEAGIKKRTTSSSVDIQINFGPSVLSMEAGRTRRCRCHATWATLY
jgi:hypothetical protein